MLSDTQPHRLGHRQQRSNVKGGWNIPDRAEEAWKAQVTARPRLPRRCTGALLPLLQHTGHVGILYAQLTEEGKALVHTRDLHSVLAPQMQMAMLFSLT